MSVLVAISIVLTRYASIMLFGGTVRLGFGNIPIIFAGLLLGPWAGALTGIVSDLIGVMLNPQGTFHLGFTLSSALTGIIPGLVAMFFRRKSFRCILISNLLVYLVVSLLLNTLWLSQLYGKAFLVLLPGRILTHGMTSAISIAMITFLMISIKHINIDDEIK